MHQGVEFGASVELLRTSPRPTTRSSCRRSVPVTISFVNDPIYENNPIADIPLHVLRTTLTYSRPDNLGAIARLSSQGAYADYMHKLETQGYALIGVQERKKLK